ncbi:MAG TPA: nitroreductase [Burkholderiaceae bacterium]|nr:nitroreductase [Burkholderiaceae bacterium]
MQYASETLDHLNRLFDDRWSCRAFRDEPVADSVIASILASAQRTASWCNSQSWQVTITKGAGTERLRERLLEQVASGAPDEPDFPFPREYRGVYLERRRRSGFQLYEALQIARGDKEAYRRQSQQNFRFFGAPHVAIVTTDEALGVYGAVDCGGFVSNFLLAATAHGVATIAQAALSRHARTIREALGIGDDRRMVCGVSFGYALADDPVNVYRTERAGLDEVLRWAAD